MLLVIPMKTNSKDSSIFIIIRWIENVTLVNQL